MTASSTRPKGSAGIPAEAVAGAADVQFQLFTSFGGGVPIATSTHLNTTITDGLFTVDAVRRARADQAGQP